MRGDYGMKQVDFRIRFRFGGVDNYVDMEPDTLVLVEEQIPGFLETLFNMINNTDNVVLKELRIKEKG